MKDYKKLCILCITVFASIFLISESLKNIYTGYTIKITASGMEFTRLYVLNTVTGNVQLYSNNSAVNMIDERN